MNLSKERRRIKVDRQIDFWRGIMLGLTCILLTVAVLGMYIQSRADERNVAETRAVQKVILERLDTLDAGRKSDSRKIIEASENIVCGFALHDPRLFPSADLPTCREKLRVINNRDGTFLSNQATDQVAPAPTPSQSNVNNNDNQALVERCLLIACLKIERP